MRLIACLIFLALWDPLFAQKTPTLMNMLPALDAVNGEQQRQRATAMITANYERWLKDPAAFRKLVDDECGLFPEGQLYPYFLPAMAFAQLSTSDTARSREHLARSELLLKMGLPVAGKIVDAKSDDLLQLKDYDRQATTLSTVSLALGLYRWAGGTDPRLQAYHRHINQLLGLALARADGQPIHSYPNYSWNYDTVASLVALRLAPDLTPNIPVNAIWRKHELWIQRYAYDQKNQLPYSVAGFGYTDGPSPPRGCDVFFRVMILAYVDPPAARALFARCQQALERETGQFYGFAEYPLGAKQIEDNDSGPIIMDMGLSATGLAIGAARAANQPEVVSRLCRQFVFREPLLMMASTMNMQQMPGSWFWNAVDVNPQYFTGFLFGDAVMFYSLTWNSMNR
ncbi:hypothetical protein [Cerasicoccus arenae]|uniref:Uncharacterized protein n=1 Tax=Cerasicoccus arenae TaxID=424488 RepID=A0A8J3DCI1_9BACT|nr:hypothetical protein [Cerasicoccus arenae]MBK1857904.1 hypothetical protein [Cerasicoccus arenae]GHC09560.1 hypothetical protein GCM10007047_28540 [Cerasicoccus arenae]